MAARRVGARWGRGERMGVMRRASRPHPAIYVDYVVYERTPNTPITVAAVPEPGTAVLLGLGLFGLAVRRAR